MTTPMAVKSIMLKFLELLDIIRDTSRPRSRLLEADVSELGKVLQLFRSSILIMDEVDLILHPMKSELNFPIGAKEELDLSPQRWQLPIHLLDAIFFSERQRMSVAFKMSARAQAVLGEVRAVGDVLREQAYVMTRCGIDAFVPADGSSAAEWSRAAGHFRHVYQTAADGRVPAYAEPGRA
jgi:hypothetical protein